MLIGISADFHLGKRLGVRTDESGVNMRTIDLERAVSQVIDGWIAQRVDAVVVPGDLYDTSDPPERARQFLAREFNRLTGALPACRAFIGLGNHDCKMTFDDPTAIGTTGLALAHAEVVDRGAPQVIELDDEVAITIVPWMKSDEEFYRTIASLETDPAKHNLLFLHAGLAELPEYASLTPGSQTLTRSQVPLDRFDWIFSGHFHKHRVVEDLRWTFIGSPERLSSAEVGSAKGYLSYDTDTRQMHFHPIKTRSWYSLGTIDATDWDATRVIAELEALRRGIPDWEESLIWGKIHHLSTAAYGALDVAALRKIKGSAFAAEIEIRADDPVLTTRGDAGAEESADGDLPLLDALPTEWAEHVRSTSTRKGDEKARVMLIGLAALEGRSISAALAATADGATDEAPDSPTAAMPGEVMTRATSAEASIPSA